MLFLTKLPKSFYGEATLATCYLINLSPLVSLDGDERVWSEKDIFYSHLRVFWYKAFVHAPKEQNLSSMTKQYHASS